MNEITHIVDESVVARFLDGSRIALIGASDDRKSFSSTINTALTADRHEVVPAATTPQVVRECIDAGWFHRVHRSIRRRRGLLVKGASIE